jgi:hypothetical protein
LHAAGRDVKQNLEVKHGHRPRYQGTEAQAEILKTWDLGRGMKTRGIRTET